MNGPTDAELTIINALGEVWNTFMSLPVEHGDDMKVFRDGIHVLQREILARSGRRAMRMTLDDADREILP